MTLKQQVSDALRSADPMGLIKLGAPSDEYQSEAHSITRRLGLTRCLEDVLTIVYEEFQKWFAPMSVGEPKHYLEVSRSIWKAVIKEREAQG